MTDCNVYILLCHSRLRHLIGGTNLFHASSDVMIMEERGEGIILGLDEFR